MMVAKGVSTARWRQEATRRPSQGGRVPAASRVVREVRKAPVRPVVGTGSR